MKKMAADKGVMGTLVQGGVGGAAYFVAAKVGPKVTFLQSRWWALPTAMLVTGHLVKRWSPESGAAVVGAAGAMMAMSYYVNASGPTANPAPATGVFQGEAGAYGSVGPGDAGALMLGPGRTSAGYTRRSEAGALIT
jgi:hypothetical protein